MQVTFCVCFVWTFVDDRRGRKKTRAGGRLLLWRSILRKRVRNLKAFEDIEPAAIAKAKAKKKRHKQHTDWTDQEGEFRIGANEWNQLCTLCSSNWIIQSAFQWKNDEAQLNYRIWMRALLLISLFNAGPSNCDPTMIVWKLSAFRFVFFHSIPFSLSHFRSLFINRSCRYVVYFCPKKNRAIKLLWHSKTIIGFIYFDFHVIEAKESQNVQVVGYNGRKIKAKTPKIPADSKWLLFYYYTKNGK